MIKRFCSKMCDITLKAEIAKLREQLQEKEDMLQRVNEKSNNAVCEKLTNEEISRFSRQIILPEIGMKGQLALKASSVLIVGAGGLGCPSAQYLTGGGVGHIGIVDYDSVELNNLHRQLLHSESSIGKSKVKSAEEYLKRLNHCIKITPYHLQLDSSNALDIVKQYDVVIDATDNVATRYLLNDACVLTERPLVSGSALQLEGQLTVYNYKDGPCYRCVFPVPPPPEAVTNCGDGGVLGVVPGVIGVLQALETIKVLLEHPGILYKRMLTFDGSDCTFRNFKLRSKNQSCAVCGFEPSVTALVDYEQFCGSKASDKAYKVKLLKDDERISAKEYSSMSDKPHIIIDVRAPKEFEICHLPGSLNIPLKDLSTESTVQILKENISKMKLDDKQFPVFVVCRRGNDSQKGVKQLQKSLTGLEVYIRDIVGGLHSWAYNVDPSFPVY